MLSHRIDFSHLLLGPMTRLCAHLKQFVADREGHASNLDDWSSILADFKSGATGVLESSKLATGRNESWKSQDYLELNGSQGSVVFLTGHWDELQLGKPGGDGLETVKIPKEFWTWPIPGPQQGDPLVTFRYDQAFEFLEAIRQQRDCTPSLDGARATGHGRGSGFFQRSKMGSPDGQSPPYSDEDSYCQEQGGDMEAIPFHCRFETEAKQMKITQR